MDPRLRRQQDDGGVVNESLYYKYGRLHTSPESVTPWLDSRGNMRLSGTVKDRPGCVVFEVEVKVAAEQRPAGFGRNQAYYWTCVFCHVAPGALSMEERRRMRLGFLDLVSIKMGRPYRLRGK